MLRSASINSEIPRGSRSHAAPARGAAGLSGSAFWGWRTSRFSGTIISHCDIRRAPPRAPQSHRRTMKSSVSTLGVHDTLRDFTADRRLLILSAMAIATGSFGAGAAWVLLKLIALVTNFCYFHVYSTATSYLSQAKLGPGSILIPVIGGLIVGLMARYGSQKIRGHGIPEALEAILIGQSRIEPKVAVLKPLSSAIAIGTGGPFGAEGPIIMTGGALGSLFAQFFHLSSAERKTLLVAGAAAGMTAIFGTPVA